MDARLSINLYVHCTSKFSLADTLQKREQSVNVNGVICPFYLKTFKTISLSHLDNSLYVVTPNMLLKLIGVCFHNFLKRQKRSK